MRIALKGRSHKVMRLEGSYEGGSPWPVPHPNADDAEGVLGRFTDRPDGLPLRQAL